MNEFSEVFDTTSIRLTYNITGTGLTDAQFKQLMDRLYIQLRDVALPAQRQLFHSYNHSSQPQRDAGTTTIAFAGKITIANEIMLNVEVMITVNFSNRNAPEMARTAASMAASGYSHITHHLENILKGGIPRKIEAEVAA